MTEKESLQYSIELWEWLVDNPDKFKIDHPTLPVDKWELSCALCEFDEGCCHKCPMLGHWPSSDGICDTCVTCDESAYFQWTDLWTNIEYDISFFAAVFVEAFKERLEDIS